MYVYQYGKPLLASMFSTNSLKHSCTLNQGEAHASLPAPKFKFSTLELGGDTST